jgi:2-oxoglutarate ferredoxin oxidoreductase subunit gamma
VIADTGLCPELPGGEYRVHRLPLSRTALELCSERVANVVSLWTLAALIKICEHKSLDEALRAGPPAWGAGSSAGKERPK